jgi:hypothetical protein
MPNPVQVSMVDNSLTLARAQRLSRPTEVIMAEQTRHDRAFRRGIITLVASLVVGGGLAFFIQFGSLFRGSPELDGVLIFLVFMLPLSGSLVLLARVPPPPWESLSEDLSSHTIERKQTEWRRVLLWQIFNVGTMSLQSFWMWPLWTQAPSWAFALAGVLPVFVVVLAGLRVLYWKPGSLNDDPNIRAALDDEVTRSFRVRAQRLGYLLLLFIMAGLFVLARVAPVLAVRYLPLGIGVGVALPSLYFVYLDWQASRGA